MKLKMRNFFALSIFAATISAVAVDTSVTIDTAITIDADLDLERFRGGKNWLMEKRKSLGGSGKRGRGRRAFREAIESGLISEEWRDNFTGWKGKFKQEWLDMRQK